MSSSCQPSQISMDDEDSRRVAFIQRLHEVLAYGDGRVDLTVEGYEISTLSWQFGVDHVPQRPELLPPGDRPALVNALASLAREVGVC